MKTTIKLNYTRKFLPTVQGRNLLCITKTQHIKREGGGVIIIIIIITAIEFSLGGSSPYISTDKTNKNKYT